MQLFSTSDGRRIQHLTLGEQIVGMGLSPDGKAGFFSAGFADKVYVLSLPDGKRLGEIATRKEPDPVYLLP